MILRVVRLLASLSRTQYVVIFATIIFPALGFQFLPSSTVGDLIIRPIIYVLWSAIAVLFVALMLREDKSKAEKNVDQKFKNLTDEIQEVKDDLKHKKNGLQDQVDEINKVMRTAFKELNVVLPPPSVFLRVEFNAGAAHMSAKVTVNNRKKMTRFRFWFKRQSRRFWRWVYG